MRFLIALLAVAGIVVSSLALRVHYEDPSVAPPCAVTEQLGLRRRQPLPLRRLPRHLLRRRPRRAQVPHPCRHCSASSATRSSRFSRSPTASGSTLQASRSASPSPPSSATSKPTSSRSGASTASGRWHHHRNAPRSRLIALFLDNAVNAAAVAPLAHSSYALPDYALQSSYVA